jgi:hypothetical protein
MDAVMTDEDTETSEISADDPTIRNLARSATFPETASPYVIRDPAPSQSPEVYQQKRLVVEKMTPATSQLKGDLEYTKAKNRDLKRMVIQERERVSADCIEGGHDSRHDRACSLRIQCLPQTNSCDIFKRNRQV